LIEIWRHGEFSSKIVSGSEAEANAGLKEFLDVGGLLFFVLNYKY
jgi:hypothetical protein